MGSSPVSPTMSYVKFDGSVAINCRYGHCANELLKDWIVIWENTENDWQGSANILAFDGINTFCYATWTWGSCSGCDDFENRDLSNEQIVEEFRRDWEWIEAEAVLGWLSMRTDFYAEEMRIAMAILLSASSEEFKKTVH